MLPSCYSILLSKFIGGLQTLINWHFHSTPIHPPFILHSSSTDHMLTASLGTFQNLISRNQTHHDVHYSVAMRFYLILYIASLDPGLIRFKFFAWSLLKGSLKRFCDRCAYKLLQQRTSSSQGASTLRTTRFIFDWLEDWWVKMS